MIAGNDFRSRLTETINIGKINLYGDLSAKELSFLQQTMTAWNFYEGFQWEGIEDNEGKPEVTFNYCRAFVNKFVAFEFGKGFSIKTSEALENVPVTLGDPKLEIRFDRGGDSTIDPADLNNDKEEIIHTEKTLQEYLNQVWEENYRDRLLVEVGQTKSITGEAWIKVFYESPEDINDPFEEFPRGRIRLSLVPTQFVYPTFNDHDRENLEELMVVYPVSPVADTQNILGFNSFQRRKSSYDNISLYKEIWTREEVVIYQDNREVDRYENELGFIPFVQIKNFPVAGQTRGAGDLEDVIPLNVEMNTKRSDVSEVIDYHSAPITLVFGAKIANLEKGANKVWGGLPKDSRVENLNLQGDLAASTNYIKDVKQAMCEIAGIPEAVLGGSQAISNTSGVALQYMNLPLIERTRVKKQCSQTGLQMVNKMILFLSLYHGLIKKPEDISMKDFVANKVELPDTLPKDELLELQQIQQELEMQLETRRGALERMGRSNVDKKLEEVDIEIAKNMAAQMAQNLGEIVESESDTRMTPTNAGGMMNGETIPEQVRIALTGQNGGAEL